MKMAVLPVSLYVRGEIAVPTDRKFNDLTLDEQIQEAEKLSYAITDRLAPWAMGLLDLHRMELKIIKGMLEEFREGRKDVDASSRPSRKKQRTTKG